jgi:protein involved in polysaccharide export with SLBB domain
MAKILVLVAVGGLTLVGAGCASPNADLRHFLDANKVQVSAIEYRVGIPDSIAIQAPRILEIDGQTQTIQPDGKVSLPLLGDVKVVGMTAQEISLKFAELLRPYYHDPKVQVMVAGYRSKKYYVFGQVGGGGASYGGSSDTAGNAHAYTGRDTLLDALAEAGMNFIAWRSQVKVIRAHPDKDARKTIIVDVDKMIRDGDLTMNVLLEPNDIVYVPPTPVGWLGLRLQELLFPFNPVIQAYQYPANVMHANDVYEEDHND